MKESVNRDIKFLNLHIITDNNATEK